MGASVDGQYIHFAVEECLERLYGDSLNINMSWDPMHKAGLVDKRLKDNPAHKWMSGVLAVCHDLYTQFNWGAGFERYVDAGGEMQEGVTALVRTSDTRFANSKRFVFMKVLDKLPTVVKCLQDIQMENRAGGSRERQKASDSAALEGRLVNGKTLLELACLADIYDMYGKLVNVCQTVNMLPHERLDMVDGVLATMDDMHDACVNHADCISSRVCTNWHCVEPICYWKRFHTESRNFLQKSEIRGVPVLDNMQQRAGIGANQTRQRDTPGQQTKVEVQALVAEKGKNLLAKLKEDLKDQVYHPEDRALIAETRKLTDLETIYVTAQEHGALLTSAKLGPSYIASAQNMVPELATIEKSLLQAQFKVLCQSLAGPNVQAEIAKFITDNNKTGSKSTLTISKKLAQMLFSTDWCLYADCEMIAYAVNVAALKFSVESVVESIVSQYEHRFGPKHSLGETTADQEMEIYINGPNLAKCNSIVSAALDNHFGSRKKWHFLHSGSLHSFSKHSNVLGRLMKEPLKLPFMENQ